MRISNRMLFQNALRNIRTNLAALDHAQREAATGRKVRTVSDNPVDAAQIMRMQSSLNDIRQYQRNSSSANTRLSTEDAVLTTLRDLVAQAKELAMSGAGHDPSDPLRQAALTQVGEIRDQIISLGNMKVGEEYIFAGTLTADPPFQPDGTYVGNSTARTAELDTGMVVKTNHTGDQVFSPILRSLDDLVQELQSGTPDSINDAVVSLSDGQNGALAAQAEVGSRLKQIQDIGTQIASRAGTLQDQIGALRDADPSESLVKVMTAQTSLESAYSVVGRVLQTTILNYLK